MSRVFKAKKRKSIEFEYEFLDGKKERFSWKEPNVKVLGEFLGSLENPSKLIKTAGELLESSIDGKNKKELIDELFENSSTTELFEFINTLNEMVELEVEKKQKE